MAEHHPQIRDFAYLIYQRIFGDGYTTTQEQAVNIWLLAESLLFLRSPRNLGDYRR